VTFIARLFAIAAMVGAAASLLPQTAAAATAGELQRDAQAALNSLYAKNAAARALQKQAVAILVFPSLLKAGLGIGGQFGDGVLYRGGKAVAYYNTTPPEHRTVCRRARRSTATRCSSTTKQPSRPSIEVGGSSSAWGRRSW